MSEQWPPNSGIPAKSKYKKAKDLKWGETPFDDLSRADLLRLVQAYHVAASGAESCLSQFELGQAGHPYWGKGGTGGRALYKLRFLLSRSGDVGNGRENIYRKFFRTATGLLFPKMDDEFHSWGIDEKTKEMYAPYQEGLVLSKHGNKTRKIKWKDMLPEILTNHK